MSTVAVVNCEAHSTRGACSEETESFADTRATIAVRYHNEVSPATWMTVLRAARRCSARPHGCSRGSAAGQLSFSSPSSSFIRGGHSSCAAARMCRMPDARLQARAAAESALSWHSYYLAQLRTRLLHFRLLWDASGWQVSPCWSQIARLHGGLQRSPRQCASRDRDRAGPSHEPAPQPTSWAPPRAHPLQKPSQPSAIARLRKATRGTGSMPQGANALWQAYLASSRCIWGLPRLKRPALSKDCLTALGSSLGRSHLH